jgi:hypothetical protein
MVTACCNTRFIAYKNPSFFRRAFVVVCFNYLAGVLRKSSLKLLGLKGSGTKT